MAVHVTPSDKARQLERALEMRIVHLNNATDGAGLRVMVAPAVSACIPRPEDFRAKIAELLGCVAAKHVEYRGEEALARNIGLLVAAWEASVRYWDFQRELQK